jgi:hypothetical protein
MLTDYIPNIICLAPMVIIPVKLNAKENPPMRLKVLTAVMCSLVTVG